jgi:tetratricopeptide (TPR) repeat protein
MTATSRSARLRARLYRTRDDHPATRRDLAIELTRDRPRDPSSWGSLASALIDLGLYSKARATLRRLEKLARNGDHYLVCIRWGEYYNRIGDLKRAVTWYRKAAAELPAALVFLGAVLARKGRLAEAKQCHRRATRAPEDDQLARDEAYLNLALILRAERRYREALVCFERAIAMDPKYAVAFEAQADVRSALEVVAPEQHSDHWRRMLDAWGPNPATAHELVRAYTRQYPNRSGGWILFAQILAGFARYAEATTALRKAERVARSEKWREPPDHRFAVQWGFLYQEKKDFKRAELSFRRAVALHPSATNLARLAEVLVSQGRLSLAKRHLQRAIRIGSDDPDVTYYQLGLIARARGQYAEALKQFDAAIHYSAENQPARVARRDVQQAIKLSR